MTYIWLTLGWLFALLFALLAVSMVLMGNWWHTLVLFLLVLFCLPPVTALIRSQLGIGIHPFFRFVAIVGLLFIFVRLLLFAEVTSLYKTPEIKARFYELYDQKMTEWPVPYEDRFLDTQYGTVHVIISGPEDAPPMLLLHASGVSSWSWKYNVGELSQHYHTYAIDLISDVGKSDYADLNHIMQTGEDEANHYAEITDLLGLSKAYVVGASDGGFIASQYALYFPERVEKMVLLGPMGYAGANKAVTRIMFTQFFPLKPIQESTFRWAFSDSDQLQADYSEWFRLTMTGYAPKRVAPWPLTAEERQRIPVPVLFVFGTRDNLVGDPAAAKALVQDMPNAQVAIIDAGHLMGGEQPAWVNELILDFFSEE